MMLKRVRKYTRTNKNKKLEWENAPDIKERVDKLIDKLELDWLDTNQIYCLRSNYSKARAYARIWGMGRIWQEAIGIKPSYCIEVLSEKFDHLSIERKDKILLHELAHIPKNFSGALVPHTKKGKGSFHDN